MSIIERKGALIELLKGIYGCFGVDYNSNKVYLNYDRNTKQRYKLTSLSRFRLLLEVTFKNKNVVFEDMKNGKGFALDKEGVIDNTINYFRKLGIYIPDVVNTTERSLLGRRMCNAILEYILPAIYCNTENDDGKSAKDCDDISEEYNKAVGRIKTEFNTGNFFEQLYLDIDASEIERLYDEDFSEDDCNFGVLICTYYYYPFKKYKFIPSIYYYCTDNDKEQQTEPKDTLPALMAMLMNVKTLNTKNFVSPYLFSLNADNSVAGRKNNYSRYKIDFNIVAPNHSFIPRYFYFMTKLDDDIFRNCFPGCNSPAMRKQVLIEKAIRQMRVKCEDAITKYYKSTLANIEDICRKFLMIDIKTILNQEISDIKDFKKALASLCKENDIDEVWRFCKEKGLSAEQTSMYIYCSIEEAMRDISRLITDSLMQEIITETDSDGTTHKYCGMEKPDLIRSTKFSISPSVLIKHTSVLKRLFKSNNIDGLCKLRDEYGSYAWNPKTGNNLTFKNDSDAWPRSENIQNLYNQIKGNITVYCDTINRCFP